MGVRVREFPVRIEGAQNCLRFLEDLLVQDWPQHRDHEVREE
jgi:hypothetical protein